MFSRIFFIFFYFFRNFLSNYKRGRTVVPDINCNSFIKFDLLHRYSFNNLGVEAVATGHFVRNSRFQDFCEHLNHPNGWFFKENFFTK